MAREHTGDPDRRRYVDRAKLNFTKYLSKYLLPVLFFASALIYSAN